MIDRFKLCLARDEPPPRSVCATRCALASEVSSLRFSAVVSGPEAGIPRGWDEGVDDDDGG